MAELLHTERTYVKDLETAVKVTFWYIIYSYKKEKKNGVLRHILCSFNPTENINNKARQLFFQDFFFKYSLHKIN